MRHTRRSFPPVPRRISRGPSRSAVRVFDAILMAIKGQDGIGPVLAGGRLSGCVIRRQGQALADAGGPQASPCSLISTRVRDPLRASLFGLGLRTGRPDASGGVRVTGQHPFRYRFAWRRNVRRFLPAALRRVWRLSEDRGTYHTEHERCSLVHEPHGSGSFSSIGRPPSGEFVPISVLTPAHPAGPRVRHSACELPTTL